jgi:hypothetical protein
MKKIGAAIFNYFVRSSFSMVERELSNCGYSEVYKLFIDWTLEAVPGSSIGTPYEANPTRS